MSTLIVTRDKLKVEFFRKLWAGTDNMCITPFTMLAGRRFDEVLSVGMRTPAELEWSMTVVYTRLAPGGKIKPIKDFE